VLLDNGSGIFGVAEPYGGIVSGNHNKIRSAHFNSDGKLDLTFGATTLGVLINAGTGTFPALVNPGGSAGRTDLLVDDFNIDGKQDIAYGGFNILLGTGAGSFQTVRTFPLTGATVASTVSGDFDADGLKDVLIIHSASAYGGPVFMRNLSK
jgi:hypothetical protein